MRIPFRFVVMSTIALFAVPVSAAMPPLTGGALLKLAKLSPATARSKALHACPGTIVKQEIEREKGGSGLRYSFDVTRGGKTFEVGIDAKTGAILENGPETAGD